MKKGVMMQYFHWYLNDDSSLYQTIINKASELKKAGFTALWLPPAYKGQAGVHDVGYGVYDLYDLGEFDQKGSVSTKYGTKDEYLEAIAELHEVGIDVYADIVFNHKMGADHTEVVNVDVQSSDNRLINIEENQNIEAWTSFTFPGRKDKYSTFKWNKDCFSGVDYDNRKARNAIYKIIPEWNKNVDDENGNYDYLMGADINFNNQDVVDELYKYGLWYLKFTGVDGFRLDALKHIDRHFFKNWLSYLRQKSRKELFTVGEYWSADINDLLLYLKENDDCLSLFDVPLHLKFFQACNASGTFDMGSLWNDTLVLKKNQNAVTFVENHDTQAGQALESVIQDWFKPLAYACILLREKGYPCVFYGDYYGIEKTNSPSLKKEIDLMIFLRQHIMNGHCHDYFDHFDVVGWTFEGDDNPKSGLAIIMSDGPEGIKPMYIGKNHCGQKYIDITYKTDNEVIIGDDGVGLFKTNGGSYHLYVNEEYFKLSQTSINNH